MAFSVNTNAGALFALQSLNKTNSQLNEVQSRINTGLKVASARDNAAIFSIAQKQRGDLAGLSSVKGSLDRASSSVNVALAAAEAVSDLLIQLKEKASAAADPGADATARAAFQDEFKNLVDQIDTVVSNAEFNGVNAVKVGGTNIQALVAIPKGGAAAVSSASITITATDISSSAGLKLTNTVTVSTAGKASAALAVITAAETTVSNFTSKLGAGAKRVDIQRAFTDKLSDAIEIGIGSLVDADLARESANLQSLQVRQQLGLQALSIANQTPGSVLSLFR